MLAGLPCATKEDTGGLHVKYAPSGVVLAAKRWSVP